MAVVNSSPGTAAALRNMCRKRLFKKAVKQFSLHKNRGLSDDDIVAAFHDADIGKVRHARHESRCDQLTAILTVLCLISVADWIFECRSDATAHASVGFSFWVPRSNVRISPLTGCSSFQNGPKFSHVRDPSTDEIR